MLAIEIQFTPDDASFPSITNLISEVDDFFYYIGRLLQIVFFDS